MSMIYKGIRLLLKLFYEISGDYGIAVVLLTLLVRFCLLPFAIKQRRIMKQQERIEKEAEEIRKKHQKNSSKMNAELEKLYHSNAMGAGCLLPVLQLPVMLVLYQGIRLAVTVNTPTILLPWIPSLLAKDPCYLLPLLTVCVQMFPQFLPYLRFFKHLKRQKMSPQMLFLMLFANGWFSSMLPAGIGLYYLVSGIFSALEQTAFALLERNKENLLTSF